MTQGPCLFHTWEARPGCKSVILTPMSSLLPPLLRAFFPEPHKGFRFTRDTSMHCLSPAVLDLYIHVPFCRRICSFCPYVKQVYDPDTAAAYGTALLRELQSCRDAWGDIPVKSVYFGGGTPSMTPEIVETTMSWLARNYYPGGEVGVEVHPLDARPDVMRSLRAAGVTMVSLGVQTFSDRLLAMLGRGYDATRARVACGHVLSAGFDAVDIDLMFALPGQSVQETRNDVSTACELGADQVSCYPLINFADTPLGQQLRNAGVKLPSQRIERQMLNAVVTQAGKAGYQRSSIWSFNKPGAPRYTTVTRDSFVGIGAGASSRIDGHFRVNTFSVDAYIESTRNGSPSALCTRMNEGDQMAYWLFWRFYDTVIDMERFRVMFGRQMPGGVRAALQLLRWLGLMHREGEVLRLTARGAYLFHRIEKEYTHSYLEPLWSACRQEAWPSTVSL